MMSLSLISLCLLPSLVSCMYATILKQINIARSFYLLHISEPFTVFEYEWLIETRVLNLIPDESSYHISTLLRKALFSISPESPRIGFADWMKGESEGAVSLSGIEFPPHIAVDYPRAIRAFFFPNLVPLILMEDTTTIVSLLLRNLNGLFWLTSGVMEALYRYQEYLTLYMCMDKSLRRELYDITEEKEDYNFLEKRTTSFEGCTLLLNSIEQRENTERLTTAEKLDLERQMGLKTEKIIATMSKEGNMHRILFGKEALEKPFGRDFFDLVGVYHVLRYAWLLSRIYVWDNDVRERLKNCIEEFFEDTKSHCHKKREIFQANLLCRGEYQAIRENNNSIDRGSLIDTVSVYYVKDKDNFVLKLFRWNESYVAGGFSIPFVKEKEKVNGGGSRNELIIYTTLDSPNFEDYVITVCKKTNK